MPRELIVAGERAEMDQNGLFRKDVVLGLYSVDYVFVGEMAGDGATVACDVEYSDDLLIVDFATSPSPIASGTRVDVTAIGGIRVQARRLSASVGSSSFALTFRDSAGRRTWRAELALTIVEVTLLADFDRDGSVDEARSDRTGWSWGRDGCGAILLVNSDRDTAHPSMDFRDRLDRRINGPLDLLDMTPAVVAVRGPSDLPLVGATIRLHVTDVAASRLRIFDLSGAIPAVLIERRNPIASLPFALGERRLAIEGVDYPDAGFSGLITLHAELVTEDGIVIGGDRLVLRVAPWLALPNTQPPQELYMCDLGEQNSSALEQMREVAEAAGIPFTVVPPEINRNDRWLQDEIEIGYAAMPGKRVPVVLDSPRNRQLDIFPERMLLGPDFGYVTRGNDGQPSSLDSFGNLDCTPSHVGPKGAFPFGRVVFGGAQPGARNGRRLMKVVADFLYAQQVQYPIELFSDWLYVGHVDEFMSFVPAPDRKQFRLVLASPSLAYAILEEVAAAGHGRALLKEGKHGKDGVPAQRTVREVLEDAGLRAQNQVFRRYIGWNKAVLIEEMGLEPADIIEIPGLYEVENPEGRAGAWFPGMVNMQVLGAHLAIPKPFGPIIDGRCAFEQAVVGRFEPLGLSCHFIDTYESYHLQLGEIHCGTNVRRAPFVTPWWEFDPAARGDVDSLLVARMEPEIARPLA